MYNYDYFTKFPGKAEQMFWDNNEIRYGDQLACIGYACGATSFAEIQKIVGFKGNGGKPMGKSVKSTLYKLLGDRLPKSVLEIGGGRGELSLGLAWLGISVMMAEICEDVDELVDMTREKLDIKQKIYLRKKGLKDIGDYSTYDTIIFCESIEHIEEKEIRSAFKLIEKQFKGLVIIANWINFHPIPTDGVEHITLIDDDFYKSLPGKVIYQEGSHLILEI